jgi:anti-anti-sigma regulatory factor
MDGTMTHDRLADDHPHTSPPTFTAYTRLRVNGDVEVVLKGTLDADKVPVLDAILASARRMAAPRVCLDLAGVTSWSLLAEAAVLGTARDLEANGSRLVLQPPGDELRRQGSRLGLFARVPGQR